MAGMNDEGRQWYVVCTYNGHENKVKENLEKRIESMGLQDCLSVSYTHLTLPTTPYV